MEAKRLQRIEALIARMQAVPDPAIRADFTELLETVLELHGSGLERILELVQAIGEPGRLAVAHFAAEPLVASLLVLHGIHPDDLATRVHKALLRIRGAEFVGIEDGLVRVRIPAGSDSDYAIGILREAAPDAADIVVEEMASRSNFVPLENLALCNRGAGE